MINLAPRTYVHPAGIRASAKLLIVGEQPGVSEVRQGKPFIGMAGQALNDCLAAANLVRGECYLTNVIKDLDHPLSYYYQSSSTKSHFTDAGQTYIGQLRQELEDCPAKFILAVGNVALQALTGRTGITKWRGSVLPSTLVPDKWVVPIIHPATIIPPKCVWLNRPLIIHDLRRVAQLISRGEYKPYECEAIIRPSFQDSCNYLLNVIRNIRAVAFDIEVVNQEVSCISFCHDPHRAISIAFVDHQGDIFSCEQEVEIWHLVAQILSNPSITKIGQNLTFDTHFLLKRYGIRTSSINDTMIAQQIIMPDYPKGLDFITSLHTPLSYYKDEGKQWFRVGGSWEQLWVYNCYDSLACWLAWPAQYTELQQQQNVATYKRQCNIVYPLVYMMEHGIRADLPGIREGHKTLVAGAEPLRARLEELAGRPLNPNSPKQLQDYFYVEKKFPHYKNKITGEITVDADALKRMSRKGSEEARLILQYRKNMKLANTYLVEEKFDADGRIRCSYNPVGTRYSRLSSSANIFGTGMNLQNWPHLELRHLMVDEGYIGYAFDLSQAENRIVAYYGCVDLMIKAFEDKQDVHSLTAALIFDKHPADVTTKDGTCSLGDGTHSERFWGKKANHGLNYDLGYRSFALYYEMSERDAKFIVSRYHKAYPGVRQVFHKLVRDQLHTTRTVTNLMNRQTLFMGRLDDTTFKEAYSCIPQGTVGDIINEYGLSHIYDNRDHYAPIELLSQTHDEITFQIPLSIPLIEHAKMLLDIKKSLEVPFTVHGRQMIIPADLTMFQRFKQGRECKFPHTTEELVEVLNRNLEGLLNDPKH